ncbi:MAG: hypothetical protein ACP5N5_03760 [Desulfurococcus sp.]|uniref:hypothetical protein n=1 Tax=Desulfurococcus sp. TaxID=51678 RepID=UPI003D0E3B2C
MKTIKCPWCGFMGEPGEFLYIQEATLYYTGKGVDREERERPLMVVCPGVERASILNHHILSYLKNKGLWKNLLICNH